MTTIDSHASVADESPRVSVTAAFFSTVAAWAVTTDHKKIGRLYLGFGLLGIAAAGVLGVLLGFERSGGSELVDVDSLLQIFQAQRFALVVLGLIPLALGLAIAVAPLQLGARQIAFPRLALAGCYAWIGGAALTLAALGRNGGSGGGDGNAVDLFVVGHGLATLGLVASAGCVAVSVLTARAPGMTMRRVPLFAWSSLIGAIGLLLALPVLFGLLVYLYVDHRLGRAENFGGAEGVLDWIGWAWSVPVAIAYALPAVGVAAELVPVTFKHRPVMRGVTFAGIALVGVAALSGLTQQTAHPLSLDTDQSFGTFVEGLLPFLLLACLPLLGVVVVMGLGGLTAKAGMANGRPRPGAAFLFAFLGLAMIGLGIVANALHGITDLELAGTTWGEGATTLVAYGALMGVLGGVVFWAPKLWGRSISDIRLAPLALLAAAGTVLSGAAMCVAGLLDQPGGVPGASTQVALVADAADDEAVWNVLAAIGHGLVALAVVLAVGLLVATVRRPGEAAADNPVGGHTIEWSAASPAPADNFEHVPTVASATPQFDMTYEASLP